MSDSQQFKYLSERSAESQDEIWLWGLYSTLLKPSIDKQWGWDEAFQRASFKEHLPYSKFSIIEKETVPIAAYAVEIKQESIYLAMLLVDSEHQSHGVGSHVLNLLKRAAKKSNRPIELSIFPANPVERFYERNDFRLIEQTTEKSLYRWTPL